MRVSTLSRLSTVDDDDDDDDDEGTWGSSGVVEAVRNALLLVFPCVVTCLPG